MAEEQHEESPPVQREKKVTLQSLEEVDLYQKWTINLRILLEPIAILRYVAIVSISMFHYFHIPCLPNNSDCAAILCFYSYCVC